MDSSFLDAMRRAAKATRAGDPLDATRMIQDALSNTPRPTPTTAPVDDFDGVTIDATVESSTARKTTTDNPDAALMLSQSYRGPAGSRDYRLFLPPQAPQGIRGLILMLHGCTQGPDDFARGTAMNRIAAREGLLVVYPGQTSAHNANGCWNWFDPANQHRESGEPAILAALVQEVAKVHSVPAGAIFAAGLSAGGAMAALLGRAYPEVFSAIGIHSGLPAGAAQDIPSAFAAMNGSAPGEGFPLAPGADHARMMIVHGARDRTVVPANGARLFDLMQRHYPAATVESVPGSERGLTCLRLVQPDGSIAAEYWKVAALGHAWSGGDPSGSYTAPRKPDASEGFVRFFLKGKA